MIACVKRGEIIGRARRLLVAVVGERWQRRGVPLSGYYGRRKTGPAYFRIRGFAAAAGKVGSQNGGPQFRMAICPALLAA